MDLFNRKRIKVLEEHVEALERKNRAQDARLDMLEVRTGLAGGPPAPAPLAGGPPAPSPHQ